jgi:hypothetical protein
MSQRQIGSPREDNDNANRKAQISGGKTRTISSVEDSAFQLALAALVREYFRIQK